MSTKGIQKVYKRYTSSIHQGRADIPPEQNMFSLENSPNLRTSILRTPALKCCQTRDLIYGLSLRCVCVCVGRPIRPPSHAGTMRKPSLQSRPIPATAKTPEQNMFSLLTFGSLKFGFPERTFTRPCKKNNIRGPYYEESTQKKQHYI